MSILQSDYWPCPFCEKGMIEVLIRPTSYKYKKTTGGKGGSATVKRKVDQQVIVVSDFCKNCGKKDLDIEAKWREIDLL